MNGQGHSNPPFANSPDPPDNRSYLGPIFHEPHSWCICNCTLFTLFYMHNRRYFMTYFTQQEIFCNHVYCRGYYSHFECSKYTVSILNSVKIQSRIKYKGGFFNINRNPLYLLSCQSL